MMNTNLYVNLNLLPLDNIIDGRPGPGVFNFLKESGVSGIEVVLMDDGGIKPGDTVSLEYIAAYTAKIGLELLSTHAPFSRYCNLIHEDLGRRAGAIAQHLQAIAACKILGTSILVIHPASNVGPFPSFDNALPRFRTALDMMIPLARELGITLAVENMNHPVMFGSKPEHLMAVFEGYDSKAVGFCYDSGHAQMTHNWREMILGPGDRLTVLHLNDSHGIHFDEHLPPFLGDVDWKEQIELINEQFDGPLKFEVVPVPQKDVSKEVLKGTLKMETVSTRADGVSETLSLCKDALKRFAEFGKEKS